LVTVDRRVDAGERVRGMPGALFQRGPDGEGHWVAGEAALGHRRLAIIDVAGGAQPLVNETGSVRVVCNGEIYNYRALRAALEARGHRFQTASHCETIGHLYEDDGPDGPARRTGRTRPRRTSSAPSSRPPCASTWWRTCRWAPS